MRKLVQLIISSSLACWLFGSALWAQEASDQPRGVGLSVAPGGLAIQHIAPGETYDLGQFSGVSFTVSNQDTQARTYQLSSHRPSAVGNRKWLPGYLEIPDPTWFWFEEDEVTVGPEGESSVAMYLKVPEGEQYYNQHWVVSIGVRGRSKPGEMLALAVYPRYQIETASKADVETVPEGSLGLAPSVLVFDELVLGRRASSRIVVYNGDASSHRYTVSVKTIPLDPTREQIIPSPGYTWIPDPAWVSVRKKKFTLKESAQRAVRVDVTVPDRPDYYRKRWEALLWIEPDEGRPRFVRVQIDSAKPPPDE